MSKPLRASEPCTRIDKDNCVPRGALRVTGGEGQPVVEVGARQMSPTGWACTPVWVGEKIIEKAPIDTSKINITKGLRILDIWFMNRLLALLTR